MLHHLSAMAALVTASQAFMWPARWASATSEMRGCILTFHRVARSADWATLPNRNFYIDLDFLDRALSRLAKTGWAVVTVDEALRRAAKGEAGDRFVNFSVDDCYRDTYEELVPLFRRHNVPLTIYVTTGIPDATLPLCFAGLEDVLRRQSRVILEDGAIEVETTEAKRAAYARIAAAWDGPQAAERYETFCRLNNIDADTMHAKHAISWDMLESLKNDPLVEIGAHTMSHPRVSALSAPDALAELAGSRARLIERLGIDVRHHAFPYGRAADCGPRDFELARQAGYVSAATTRKGLVKAGQDVFDLPRNTLNGSHRKLAMLELHLSGLSGAAARVLGRV